MKINFSPSNMWRADARESDGGRGGWWDRFMSMDLGDAMLFHVSDVLWYAVILAVSSTVSPVLLSRLTQRHNHQDRMEDWARQDAVAAQAAHAAQLLLESNLKMAAKASEAAQLLVIDNKKVAANATLTLNKLDAVHTLVNSSMTAAMQSELDAIERELVLMKEVVLLHKTAGHEASPDALAGIQITKAKIAELTIALNARVAATKKAEAELARPVTSA